MSRSITTIAALALLTTVAALPAGNAAHGGYDEHAPIACVDGVLVTTYEGRAYDPSGVTGTGTEADPFVISTVQVDLTGYPTHRAGLLLINCDHVLIQDVQTYGHIGRYPACLGALRVQPGEVAAYGILVQNSTDVAVENSVLKAGRFAGVRVDGASDVSVTRSDVKANYGSGLIVMGASALLNVTDSWVAYNGFFQPPDHPWRNGRPVHEHAAGAWAGDGATLEMFNNSFSVNVNQMVVDKGVVATSDALANLNSLEANYWRDAVVALDTRDVTICTEVSAPGWVGPGQVEDPWGPEGLNAAARWPTTPEEGQGSAAAGPRRAALEPLGIPNPLGGPDATTDPVGTINARLNYWGQMEGPLDGDTSGSVDTKLWLSAPPPGALVAGAVRDASPSTWHEVQGVQATLSRTLGRLLP